MSKVRIEVTAADIATGVSCNFYNCPIACAMRRIGFERPFVTQYQVGYGPPDNRTYQLLPLKAERFIDQFDRERPVEPFSFELETE